MFKKLSVKIAVYTMLVLILTIGAATFFYASNAKKLYVHNEKDIMEKALISLNKINFSRNIPKIDDFLEEYYEQTYDLYICDENLAPVFSTKRSAKTADIIKAIFYDSIDEFSENCKPTVQNEDKRNEVIVLKAKIENYGKNYYVFIEQSLKTNDSVFTYTNRFLLIMVCGFVIISGILVIFMLRRTTKSLTRLSEVTTRISKGDYTARYNGKIENDEIGVLANNLNLMADKISENLNSLNNYNFLLKEDNKRMTEYENMRKRVLTNITHELKTPLAIISSQIEMMTVTKDDNKKLYYYNSALEEIDKMSKLISRLLNFQAGEKNVFENETKTLKLDKIIKSLCKKCEPLLATKQLTLETDIRPFEIESSNEIIEHIFDNYIMNAIQNCRKKGKIKVGLIADDFKCRLSVFNEGKPIPDEKKEKIWTDFYKSAPSKEADRHSGIGLFIIKEISLINHDECGFENKNNGVEFRYDFNLVK